MPLPSFKRFVDIAAAARVTNEGPQSWVLQIPSSPSASHCAVAAAKASAGS
jgi:hypothetical protein